MNTATKLAKKVWTHSADELFGIARRRARQLVGKGDLGWDYSLSAVVKNPKHMDCRLEIERWERQWRICRLNGLNDIEDKFSLTGKTVLELGCGPVMGFGPIAIFRGAERFWYCEPDLLRTVMESSQLRDRYFRQLFQELVANYGELQSFDEWYSRVIELSQPLPEGAPDEVDITLSNSVLEHIPRSVLPQILGDLYIASRPGGCFFHTVDFGPHGGSLASIYREEQAGGRPNLNLLRKSDIEAAIAKAGFKIDASIIYKADDIAIDDVHISWRKYSRTDLESRVVFMTGRRDDVVSNL